MENCFAEIQRDGSFLSARAASIEPWKKPIIVAPKNLCSSVWNLIMGEQYRVYLRIKPNPVENTTQIVLDNYTLLTKVPKESVNFKLVCNNTHKLQRKFAFTSILDETASQNDIFKECVLPQLKGFLQGEDSLIMAFGTTSAGKTYTMQGTSHHPGIIPRALSYIFRKLDGLIEESGSLQPYRGTQLLPLSQAKQQQELTFKNHILYLDLIKYQKTTDSSYMSFKSSYSRDEDFVSEAFKEMEEQISNDDDDILKETGDRFAVWISMVEIYNENIYDLLQFPSEKRTSLVLGEDERGGFYVKNTQQINVRNGHEAYQICQFGRTNLHRAPTALNNQSSRSHCVLTVTLVRYQPEIVTCHRISFVDLAGSERVKKTLNGGQRLLESNSINKSLSVLGACLKAMKANQSGKGNCIVPVRNSKMTKLFKNALTGVEKLTFLINISTDPILFDETLHVLNFSALAREILPDVQPVKSKSRFSQMFHSNRFQEPTFAWSAASSVSDLTDKSEYVESRYKKMFEDSEKRVRDLEREIQNLKEDNQDLKMYFEESEKRAEGLKNLFLESQGDMRTIQINMNDHVRKVVKKMNETKESDLSTLRAKMIRDKERLEQSLKADIELLTTKNRKLKEKLKEMVHPDDSYDAAYHKLAKENVQLRAEKEELAKCLHDAAQDYQEALELNEQLQKDQCQLLATNEELADPGFESKSGDFEELSIKLEESENELRNLKAEYAEFKLSNEVKVKQLEDEHERQQAEMKACYDEKIAQLLTELSDTKNKVDIQQEMMEKQTFTTDLEEIKLEVEVLKLEKDAQDHEIHELEQIIRECKDKMSENKKSQMELQNKLEEKELEIEELQTSLKTQEQLVRQLQSQLVHEKTVVESLESESEILRKSVKESCNKESSLLDEIKALKALTEALEKETIMHNSLAFEKLSKQVASLTEEKAVLEKCYISAQDESQRKSDQLKSLTLDLTAASKKLQVAEYQESVFEALKLKLEEDTKIVPELKTTIERLENELINKDREFTAFDNGRKILTAQHEIEVEKYREEIERLKKEVEFNRNVMMENLKASNRKDEPQKDLFNKRSPLKNRTNLVPVGKLVDISPFNKFDIHHVDHGQPLDRIFTSMDNLNENVRNSSIKDLFVERTSAPVSPKVETKSGRKPRTAKKRDPTDHPALARATRSQRKSQSPVPDKPRSVKKQLFSNDDFVDLSDQDEEHFAKPQKRTLRPRTRKN